MTAIAAQAQTPEARTPFRTPWGHPDLQGIWSNATLTPLERPRGVDEEYLTPAEAEELDRTGLEQTLDPSKIDAAASGEASEVWLELGQGVRSRRTSLVIDPPDGRVPFTPEGAKRKNLEMARLLALVPIDSWRDRALGDRCLQTGVLFVPNAFSLNNHQIFQTPDHVAIKSEFMNETRIVPLGGQPLAPGIELWSGASMGRWEDSLVVETTNFNDAGRTITSSSALRLVERFTRVDATTIDYELTVTDPVVYRRPWTMANTLRAIEGPIYEYACHEGNYSVVNILAGARAEGEARRREQRAQQIRSGGTILTLVALALVLFIYRRGRGTTADTDRRRDR